MSFLPRTFNFFVTSSNFGCWLTFENDCNESLLYKLATIVEICLEIWFVGMGMFLLEKRFQVYKVLNMYEMLDILVLWIWWVDGQSRTIMKTFLFEEHLRNRGANIQWRHYLAINIISYLEDTHNSPLGRRRSVPWGFSNADHILVNKSFEVFHKSVYRRTACLSRVDIWISRKCANIKESSIRSY